MKTLYLIRGLPGSGKSTLAEEMSAAMKIPIVCADDYFMQDGEYRFNPTELPNAHMICQKVAKSILGIGRSVIVANTSTTEKEVKTYADMAAENNAMFVSIIVENRHSGVNVHNVPDEAINRMRQRFSIKL